MKLNPQRLVGIIGTIAYVYVFARSPSFPTPDKIFVLLVLGGLAMGQATEILKRFTPFVALLLVYESFRGIADKLNSHVNFDFMPAADKVLFFGHLPTKLLQNVLWRGHVTWYDFVFYGAYTLHFILPFALAVLVWKTRIKKYWQVVGTYIVISFMAFLTFLAFPAAPPWMASDQGRIEPIAHVSSAIWGAVGIKDFPSVYNKISPNAVAAVPSLHAGYSFLFAYFLIRLYKTKWRWLSITYPLLIWTGTTYQGEHYVIDVIFGIIYAAIAIKITPYIVSYLRKALTRAKLLRL